MLATLRQTIYGRKYHRVLADPDFPINLHINALGRHFDVTAYDISEGGLGFELPPSVSKRVVGSPLALTVSLPEEEAFIVVAKIRHLTESVFGIEFHELERAHRKKIARYVKRVAKEKPTLIVKGYKPTERMDDDSLAKLSEYG